jgi:hypothetical protein
MMKPAFLALAALLCGGQLLMAEPFSGSLLDQPQINSPWALLDHQDRFSFSTAFGSMRANPEYLPVFDPDAPLSTTYSMAADNKTSVDRVVELRSTSKVQFGGEIGFLYGKSTGSGFGREDFAGYIVGTVGNDKFSITAGYYRQETTYSGRGWRR